MKFRKKAISILLAALLAFETCPILAFGAEIPTEDLDETEEVLNQAEETVSEKQAVLPDEISAEGADTENIDEETSIEESEKVLDETDQLRITYTDDQLELNFKDFSDTDDYKVRLVKVDEEQNVTDVAYWDLSDLKEDEETLCCTALISLKDTDGKSLLESDANYQVQVTGDTIEVQNFTSRSGVENLTIQSEEDTMTLSWDALKEDASSLTVSVYLEENPTDPIQTQNLSADATQTSIDSVEDGVPYEVEVKAVYEESQETYTSESEVKEDINLSAPEEVSAEASVQNIVLSFTPSAGATSYNIYRNDTLIQNLSSEKAADEASSSETPDSDQEILSYTDQTAQVDTEYVYYMEAVYEQDGNVLKTSAPSSSTKAVSLKAEAPAKVTGVSYKLGNKAIALTWTAVENATSYIVYRYNTSKKAYVSYATVTTNYYRNTSLTSGNTYKYKIQAVTTINDTSYTGEMSDVISAKAQIMPTKVLNLKANAKDASVTLSWSKTTNASGYRVFYYDPETKSTTKIADTTSLTYTVSNLNNNQTYSFVVCAYRTISSVKTLTDLQSDPVTATPKALTPEAPSNFKAVNNDEQVLLSWSKGLNANLYELYRKEENETDFTLIYSKTDTANTTTTFTGTMNTTANMRIKPDTTSKIVKTLKKGQTITIIGQSGSYYQTASGYVNSKYVNASSYVAATASLSFTDDDVVNGVTYTYQLRGVRNSGGVTTYSDYVTATVSTAAIAPGAPTDLKLTQTQSTNTLTWTAGRKAEFYRVYKYSSKTGKYSILLADNLTDLTFTETVDPNSSDYFKYKVVSCRILNDQVVESTTGAATSCYALKYATTIGTVRTIHYKIRVTTSSKAFKSPTSTTVIKTIPTKTIATELQRSGNRSQIKLSDGTVVWISRYHLTRLSSDYSSGSVYSASVAEAWINYKNYSSSTKYIIWISQYTQHIFVFKGSQGNWKLYRCFRTGTGKTKSPTPMLIREVWGKDPAWYNSTTYEKYCTKWFSDNAFHTRLLSRRTNTYCTNDIDHPVSNGCCRMMISDAQWIYNNIPLKTKVISW